MQAGQQKYKLIGCSVLREETEALLSSRPGRVSVDREWLSMEFHEHPQRLRQELRRRLAAVPGGRYDAILLLYGLCCHATVGLTAPEGSLLVIPRVHDCIALHLGSAARHREEAEKEPGTLWLSRGYLARHGEEIIAAGVLGAAAPLTGPDGRHRTMEEIRQELAAAHGEEGAAFLIRELGESWKKNYTRVVHVASPDHPERGADNLRAEDFARHNDWRFASFDMDPRLLRMLVDGDWPEGEFLVVRPGERVKATNDAAIIRAEGGQ